MQCYDSFVIFFRLFCDAIYIPAILHLPCLVRRSLPPKIINNFLMFFILTIQRVKISRHNTPRRLVLNDLQQDVCGIPSNRETVCLRHSRYCFGSSCHVKREVSRESVGFPRSSAEECAAKRRTWCLWHCLHHFWRHWPGNHGLCRWGKQSKDSMLSYLIRLQGSVWFYALIHASAAVYFYIIIGKMEGTALKPWSTGRRCVISFASR